MPKFSIDLDPVVHSMSKKTLKLADVQGKIEKIGFDIVRFHDAADDELWQIQSGDDGDYIVALYDNDEKVVTASAKPWSVLVKNADLHIFYKQDHICKVAASQLGFQEQDLTLAKRYLPEKLAANKVLVKALLKSVDQDTSKAILSKYPELA